MSEEEYMDQVGEILFNMISTAMRERGLAMEITKWNKVDGRIKENYMGVVREIRAVEPPIYVKDSEKLDKELEVV